MKTWNEAGYVSSDMTCPKCGGVLLIHGDGDILATCTRCLTAFVENRQ